MENVICRLDVYLEYIISNKLMMSFKCRFEKSSKIRNIHLKKIIIKYHTTGNYKILTVSNFFLVINLNM